MAIKISGTTVIDDSRNAVNLISANVSTTFNTSTANVTTIVTGNTLTLSTGTGSNSNVIITANGTEYVRVTHTGDVGIGTTTPTSNLHVIGSANVTTLDTQSINATTVNAATFVTSTGANLSNAVLKTGDTMTGNLNVAATVITQNAQISSNLTFIGNTRNYAVWAGDTGSPIPDKRLNFTSLSGHGRYWFDNYSGAAGGTGFSVAEAGTERAYFGTSSNNFTFTVYQPYNLRFASSNGNTETAIIYANSNTFNVGIGTTDPTSRLHVIGTANITSTSTFGDNITLDQTDASPGLSIRNRSSSTSRFPQISIDNYDSNNGMGVIELRRSRGSFASPASVQSGDLLGGFNTWGSNGTSFISATRINSVAESTFSSSVNAHMAFLTTSGGTQAERMRIAANGNVGIGTPNPLEKLMVSGNVYLGIMSSASTEGSVFLGRSDGTQRFHIIKAFNSGVSAAENYLRFALHDSSFPAGNTDVLTMLGSGNVGIGNTAPASKLVVEYTANNFAPGIVIRNTNADNTTQSALDLTTNDGNFRIGKGSTAGGGQGFLYMGTADPITFATNALERMRILADGNVAIGTSATEAKFEVQGTANNSIPEIRIQSTDGVGRLDFHHSLGATNFNPIVQAGDKAIIFRDTGAGTGGGLVISPHISSYGGIRIEGANGNVSIGTSTADQKLVVNGAIQAATTGNNGDLYLGGPNVSIRSAYSSNVMGLYTNNSERMRIVANGDVSIGTSAPVGRLHVQSSLDGTFLRLQRAGGSNIPILNINLTESTNLVEYEATGAVGAAFAWKLGASERMRIASDGNVSIGTSTSTHRLTVYGTLAETNPIVGLLSGKSSTTINNGAQIAFGYNGSPQYMHFVHTRHNASNVNNSIDFFVSNGTQFNSVTSGSIHVMSLNSGNVGIGITSPTSTLHVIGTANVTANVVIGGNTSIGSAGGDYGRSWRFVAREDKDAVSNFGIINGTVGASAVTRFSKIGGTGNSYLDWDLIDNSGAPYDAFNYGPAVQYVRWFLNGSERMRLSNTGNVGIGTTNPTSNLHVNGSSILGGAVSSSRRIDIDSSGRAVFAYGDNALVSQITLDNLSAGADTDHGSGILWRLATNASSTAINAGRISVAKQQVWTSTTSTQDAYMAFSTTSDGSLSERMRIDSTGNVGIGTTNPSQRLHVVGNTLITQDLTINGNLFVEGNTTTFNVATLEIEDNEIILNSNTAGAPSLNAFITIDRGSSTNTFLIWNEAADKWGWTDNGTTIYTFDTALSAYGQANAAYGQANAAYTQANSAFTAANNRVLKAGDTMTGQLNISSGGLLVTGNATINSLLTTPTINVANINYVSPNGANTITSTMYNGGTLSFDSTSGQLFSITDSLTGSIFSVNDISGIPSIEVFDTGEVRLAQYSGNVGIGVANATSKLHVVGTANITSNVIVNGGTLFVDAVGNEVGIGITNPTSNLHVIGTANVSANLTVGAGSAAAPALTTAGDNNTGLYFPAADTIGVVTGGSERARFFANGWFGYGTTTPGLGYHVVAPGVRLETNDGNFDVVQAVSGWTNSTYHQIIRWIFNGVYDDHLYFASGGNTPVNTQSALILSENSGLLFGKGNTNSNTVLTTVNFTVNNSGVGYFRGNVGIGTSSPTSNLHVIGTANVSANLTVGAGSAAAPSITTAGDNNTGIFFPAADTIAFAEGGSEAMRIDSAGNVGIANTSPAVRFQIGTLSSTSTATPETLSLGGTFSSSAGAGTKLRVYDDGSLIGGIGVSSGQLEVNTWSGGKIAFYRGTTQSMIIDASSNVGIGTTNPAQKLDVTTSSNDDGIVLNNSSTNGGRIRLNSTGTGGRNWHINSTANGSGDGGGKFIIRDNSASDAGRLTIDSTGNVGIGTTTTLGRLHISGGDTILDNNRGLRWRDTSGNANNIFVLQSDNNFVYYNGNSRPIWSATEASSPSAGFGAGAGIRTTWDASSNVIAFITSGSERMRLSNTGNVGIGTTTPTSTLYLLNSGTGDTFVIDSGSSVGNTRFKISDGYLSYGGTGPVVGGGSTYAKFQISGYGDNSIGANHIGFALNGYLPSGAGSFIQFNRSNSGTVGSHVSANNGDQIGRIQWAASDGTNFIRAAEIRAEIDGAPGANDMPGRIVFATTADGASSSTERMRIDNTGNVSIGSTSTIRKLDLFNSGTTTTDLIIRNATVTHSTFVDSAACYTGATTNHPLLIITNNAERMRVQNDGNVAIGTSIAVSPLEVASNTTSTHDFTITNLNNGNNITKASRLRFRLTDSVGTRKDVAFITAHTYNLDSSAGNYLTFATRTVDATPTEKMRIDNNGNVSIGTTSTTYKLEVNGSFAATTKSFVIDHPTKPGMKLRYGSLEGPENGVYVRGKLTGNIIELPDYWTGLVDSESITVNLTPIGKYQKLFVEKIENNKIYVASEDWFGKINCYYTVFAERKDVEKLVVEY